MFLRSLLLTLIFVFAIAPLRAQTAGNAVQLSGTNFFRTTLWSPELFNSKSFTFEFWFNATSPGVLVGESDTANVALWDVAFAEIFPGGVIKAGAPNVPTITVGTVEFATWNHLAVVYNETNQTLSAYLNGALAGSSVGNRRQPSDNQRTAVYPFGRGGPTNLGGGNWFSGRFDEVRIWRVARDASQIAANWNRVITADQPGLMALWHFDTANNETSPDSRSVANNPALHVPVNQPMPLVASTAPFAGAAPTIVTRAATVTGNSAVLQGTVNAQGSPASVFFEWGATTAYGNRTPTNSVGSGSSDINFSETLTSLSPGTYHYRAAVISGPTTIFGQNQTFTIVGPSVQTLPATVGVSSVDLKGVANAQGIPANVFFEWGTTTAYGNATPSQSIGSGSVPVNFSHTLSPLPPGDYHYRAVLTTATQRFEGSDQSFLFISAAGMAVKLSGNDYLRTTIWSHELFDDEDFTFELWFNASAPGVLINEADTASTAAWDQAFAEIFAGGVIKAGVPGVPTFTVGTVPFGTWHHLALVYDDAANLLSAYLDGQPAGSSTGDRTSPADIQRTSIYCFGRGGVSNLGGGAWLTGTLDEIRMWRRPLSAQEIAQQYNVILNETSPSLMGNWHLDTRSATAYLSPDSSGKNNPAWYVPQTTMPLVPSTAPVTPDLRPIILTNIARAIAPFAVEFETSVNAQGTNTVVYFEYGRSNIFQRTTPQDIGLGTVPVRLTEVVSGLQLGATYDFRVVASNAFGIRQSSLGSFTVVGWPGVAYRLAQPDFLRTAVSQNTFFTDKTITIELWFNPTKAGVLASETTFSPSYDRALIEILPSGNIQAGFNGITPVSVGDAVFNQWNHVALRYSAANQTMDAFLNGSRGPSRTGGRITPADQGSPTHFAFGRTVTTKLGTGEYFGGDLEEIRVWNVARSNQDLTAARFNLLSGDEPGLVLNWRGNEGTQITDSSPRNNFGTNQGALVVTSTAPLVYNARLVGATQLETQFFVKGGTAYRLETTEDFLTWTPVKTNTAPLSGFIREPVAIENESGPQFFRVVAQ